MTVLARELLSGNTPNASWNCCIVVIAVLENSQHEMLSNLWLLTRLTITSNSVMRTRLVVVNRVIHFSFSHVHTDTHWHILYTHTHRHARTHTYTHAHNTHFWLVGRTAVSLYVGTAWKQDGGSSGSVSSYDSETGGFSALPSINLLFLSAVLYIPSCFQTQGTHCCSSLCTVSTQIINTFMVPAGAHNKEGVSKSAVCTGLTYELSCPSVYGSPWLYTLYTVQSGNWCNLQITLGFHTGNTCGTTCRAQFWTFF